MIYLYGLAEADAPPDPEIVSELVGVTGPVGTTETSCGWLIHGPHDGTEIPPKRRNMKAHVRVLEALAGDAPLLPMRFGMWADDHAAVDRALIRQSDDIARLFDRVRGRVEVGLRVGLPRDPALARTLAADPALLAERDRLAAAGGHFERAEFGRRLAEGLDRRRGAAQRLMLEAVRPFCADHVLRAPEDDVEVLSIEALVPRGEEATLAEAALDAARRLDFAGGAEPAVRLIGPVPPYNFVALTLEARAAAA